MNNYDNTLYNSGNIRYIPKDIGTDRIKQGQEEITPHKADEAELGKGIRNGSSEESYFQDVSRLNNMRIEKQWKKDLETPIEEVIPDNIFQHFDSSNIEELAKAGQRYSSKLTSHNQYGKASELLKDFLAKTESLDNGSGIIKTIAKQAIDNSEAINSKEALTTDLEKVLYLEHSLQFVADVATGKVGGPLPSLLACVATNIRSNLSPENKAQLSRATLTSIADTTENIVEWGFAKFVISMADEFTNSDPGEIANKRAGIQQHALNMIKNGELFHAKDVGEALRKFDKTFTSISTQKFTSEKINNYLKELNKSRDI